MPSPTDDLKAWLEGFLRTILATIAPAVSERVEADLNGRAGLAVAVETHPGLIEARATDSFLELGNAEWGLEVLNNRLTNLNLQIQAAYEGIITAMGLPAQEPTPPVWYTAPPTPPPTGDIADAVWGAQLDPTYNAGNLMIFAGFTAWGTSNFGAVLLRYNNLFTIEGPWAIYGQQDITVNRPEPDWDDIRSTDTILSWLQRTDTVNTWQADSGTGLPYAVCAPYPDYGNQFYLRPTFTSFPPKPDVPPPSPVIPELIAAPVWPGIADVTLGTQTTLTDGNVIDGPMDGIIVNITTHPDHAGQYGFGDTVSFAHVGAVIFRSDGDEWESAQQIAVEQHVLCPKAMRSAASATLRVNGGYGGTVTPWAKTL